VSPPRGRRQGNQRPPLRSWIEGLVTLCLAFASLLGLCSPAQATTTRSGTLQATVIDNFRTDQSTTRYSLKSRGKETPLRPTALDAEPGDRVVVTGEMRNGRLVGEVEKTASSQASPLAGERKVAVLLFTLPGDSGHSWSVEQARSRVFTASSSVSAFYEEESYGQISLTGKLRADGDVFGPFSLSGSPAGCSYLTWNDEAEQAAADAGIDLSGYQHIVYIFPYKSACQWAGIADLGGSRININGDFIGNAATAVVAHEFGHNFGLQHAGSWSCTSGGVRVQISGTCTIAEYGDPFDTMGNIGYRHNNGWGLDKLGLFAPENVQTVTTSGIYALRSALTPTSEPTVLRIPRARAATSNNITSWYYLEIRQTGGIFENVSDASTTGVSIRATAELNSPETLLLDANPATSGFGDAPLKVGQTFDGGPVQIKTLSAGSGHATVEVEVDTEPPSPPVLQATVGANGVELSWVSTDNVRVERYFVFRDGDQVDNVETPSFVDPRASVGDHDYVVIARDESRNESDPSEPLTVTVPVMSGPTCSDGKCKLAYRYSGASATWTVPPGVHEAFLTVEGAGGGGGAGGPERVAGGGTRIWATLEPLTPGQVATVSVGGRGKRYSEGGAGGFNGGGSGGFGGGGGGYTKVELDSALEVLAAGGGGGGLDGVNGALSVAGGRGGAGSEQGSAGTGGVQTSAQGATLKGGGGGSAGGVSGAGGGGGQVVGSTTCLGGAHTGVPGASGGSFTGGGGVADAGGGGGGGYVGGGQGGGGAGDECGGSAASGGGGGGSSFVAPGRLEGFDTAGDSDGWLSIQYDNPVGLAAHSYTTYGDQELDVPAGLGVLSGGSAPEGVSLTVISPPDHGSLTLRVDGSFTYVPESAYLGSDSFDYRASDPAGNYADATVALSVAGPPSALISSPPPGGTYVVGQAVPTAFSCSEGTGGTGLSSCNDSSGTTSASGGVGRLDTSAMGGHTYMVTAVSKSGLTDSASIGYTVVPPSQPPEEPREPPDGPQDPPSDDEEPPLRIELSTGVEGRSLRELLRTGELAVAVRVGGEARIALGGRAEVRASASRSVATRLVAVFKRKTVRFAAAGEKKVTLALTRQGRRMLRHLRKVRLVIAGEATDAMGQTARARMTLTLQR
jgi:Gametolysin peptidase M11/Bacterial Ig domain